MIFLFFKCNLIKENYSFSINLFNTKILVYFYFKLVYYGKKNIKKSILELVEVTQVFEILLQNLIELKYPITKQ